MADSRATMTLATWQGPFDAFLPDGTRLNIGDTLDITDAQLESAHWKPASKPAARAAADQDKADS